MIVEWRGGPWDGETFEVPDGAQWVALDAQTVPMVGKVAARTFDIATEGTRHFLVWSEA